MSNITIVSPENGTDVYACCFSPETKNLRISVKDDWNDSVVGANVTFLMPDGSFDYKFNQTKEDTPELKAARVLKQRVEAINQAAIYGEITKEQRAELRAINTLVSKGLNDKNILIRPETGEIAIKLNGQWQIIK